MLTLEQIQELREKPVNQNLIRKAIEHEQRLRLHAKTSLNRSDPSALTSFLNTVEKKIPKDKFSLFLSSFRFPVSTTPLLDRIFLAFEKVFDGRNPVDVLDFRSPEAKEDYEHYRGEELKVKEFFKTEGFDALRNRINSVLIVDLPTEQEGSKPNPYLYILDISSVLDFGYSDKIDWIIFEQGENQIAVFDDHSYRVFEAEERADITFVGSQLVVDSPHDLGECPAKFFYDTPISYDNPALKRSPATNYLGKLDELLEKETDKAVLDKYAGYPIIAVYPQDCDYEHIDEELGKGQRCSNGFLKDLNDHYLITRDGSLHQCPACGNRRLNGPGSVIEKPIPNQHEGTPDLSKPVEIITIDRNSLDYNVDEVKRQKDEIYHGTTGINPESVKQAINADQVQSLYENYLNVVMSIKQNFESSQQWTETIICKLRYGQLFESISISYGTEYFFLSNDQALELYQKARANGLDDTTLDNLQAQYYEAKYKNNPNKLARIRILNNLDPFRHATKAEVRSMYESGMITYEDFFLKVNFSTLITRFEREQISIIQFGIDSDFETKINEINQVLRGYIVPIVPVEPGEKEPEKVI